MTTQGAERPGGPAPAPPAHGGPAPATPDQEPVAPGSAGPRNPGPATPGLPPLDLDAGHLPPRSRGVIGLLEENCTVCMLCARECPDWCIYIESHKQTVPAPDSGRPRVRNVLDRFAIDFSLCMYCGICIEACPYDALFWSPEFGYPETGIAGLTHERDRLRDWMQTVPPPPAHDPGAPPPREARPAGPGAGPAGQAG
jgi:NADH-quinone oxidoreductase subunit I